MTDVVLAIMRTKRASGAEYMYSFKYAGLTCTILTNESVQAWMEFQCVCLQIANRLNSKAAQIETVIALHRVAGQSFMGIRI